MDLLVHFFIGLDLCMFIVYYYYSDAILICMIKDYELYDCTDYIRGLFGK